MHHNDTKDEGMNILIAEDDSDDRFLFQEAFNVVGISGKVHFFEDGQMLVDYLLFRGPDTGTIPEFRPSCLLLDLNMPRLNGREALQIIREAPQFKELRIFVVSTSGSPEDMEYCARLGITGYFKKPHSFEELIHIMEQVKELCSCPDHFRSSIPKNP